MRLDALIPLRVAAPMKLWLLDLSMELDQRCLAWLSAEERQRAGRFRFRWDRHRYLAAHAALRELLGARLGISPEQVCFVKGSHGKPALAQGNMGFGLSYAHRLALIGIGAADELGVDIEQQRIIPDASAIAGELFTASELQMLHVASNEEQASLLFLWGWTRKEACLKAAGLGFSHSPKEIETQLQPDRCRLPFETGGIEVGSFRIAGHVASWARLLQ